MEKRISENDRYYQTVVLTLGLKDYLNHNETNCRFVSAEPRFYTVSTNNEVKPDIVLQYGANNGVLCEVKTSFPNNETYLLRALKQIEKYSTDVVGWDSPDRKVDSHDILLLCPMMDYDRIITKLNEWLKAGKIKVTKNLCICEWGMILYPKWGKDFILIRKRQGKTNCEELNKILESNITFEVQKLHLNYEQCKFTRKEPPTEYTMRQLWLDIFPALNKKIEDFTTSVEEVLEIAYKYYIPWSNLEGEFSQIRKTWIKKAMDSFCEIGLAENTSKAKSKYIVHRSKRVNNVEEYIVKRLCKSVIKEKIKKMSLENTEAEKDQRTLDLY